MLKKDKLGRFVKGNHPSTEFRKGQIPIRKGVKLTEEEIRKRTETRRENGWFKNLTETIKKMRKPHKSHPPRSEEHKKNLSLNHRKYNTEESKRKVSLSLRGINLGKTFEERFGEDEAKKIKEKMRKNHKGMLGRHHKKESREKIGKSRLGDKNPAKKPEVKEKIRQARLKQILPIKDTSIEIKIQNFLKQLGIEFVTHFYIKEIEHKYRCDIFIPIINLVIECDGDYWHANPQVYSEEILNEKQKWKRKMDELRTKELIENGYKVVRLWGSEVRRMNINDFENKINYGKI